MNRNITWLFCFVILSVAALVGCGGGSDTHQTLVQPPVNEAGADQDVAPDSDSPDGGQDVLPDNTGNDSDVFVPDAAETGDEDQTCTAKLCDSCPKEGEVCGDYTCNGGMWIEIGDSGIASSPCINPEAGNDADADQPEADADQADAETPEADADQADAETPEADAEVPQEICNGVDDNGNGLKDEGFSCIGGTSGACWTSCGTQGTLTCAIPSCTWGACVPPAENCSNGLDDDCNGKYDCADPDCTGFIVCKPEICNGVDDNGNGLKDEGFSCIGGTSGACWTSCGTQGTLTCAIPSCTWGACVPPAENCSNGLDDDCNGKYDCADQACVGLPVCNTVEEICNNGIDDNNNGLIDCADPACAQSPNCQCVQAVPGNSCANYAIGTWSCNQTWRCNCGHDWDDPNNASAFTCLPPACECVVGSQPISCTTTCGTTGTKACKADCQLDACQNPAENCSNGIDDDCDDAPDCWDSDCLNTTGCQHDFGTCQAFVPTNQPYTCGVWQQDVMPDGMFMVKDGCANSLTDQWVVGGTYSEGRVRHLTNGTTWQDVALPPTTDMVMGVTCMGATDTYIVAVESPNNGVLLRWNGTALVRLAEAQTHDVEFNAVWASSPNNVWIYGRTDYGLLDGAYIYMWDGNTMSRRKLPQLYAPMTFHPAKIWGSGPNDVYLAGMTYDPNDRDNSSKIHGGLMHYDGKSWGKVTIPAEVSFLLGIHGTSACDVMVTGDKVVGSDSTGITLQRNGTSWMYKTYTNLDYVESVAKVGAFKYVLQGSTTVPKEVWMGTDQGDFNVTWNRNISYLASWSDFWHGGATWNVPGTNVMVTAGDGKHAAGDPSGYGEYAHVFRSICQ